MAGTTAPPPSPQTGFLLGEIGDVRPALARYGGTLSASLTDDVLGNATGGKARGLTNEGQIALGLEFDLARTLGIPGGKVVLSSFSNYGAGLSAAFIDNLNLVSSIERLRSAWLYESYYQQDFRSSGASLRVGQLGADTEFLITQYGSWFVNTAFGWPSLPSVDLPAGGPAAPLATPGIRLKLEPTKAVTMLFAAFNGDPAGPGLNNPQRRDPSGTLFRLGDGVFLISEAQYRGDEDAHGRSATFKLGGWFHSKSAPNQFFANDGLTLVPALDSASSIAVRNYSGYAVADAMVLPKAGDAKHGLAVFARGSASPAALSPASLELAAGLVFKGPLDRALDQVGLAVTSVRTGKPLGGGILASRFRPSGFETVIEASYQLQATPWLQVQPDLQYVVDPGGGIDNPDQPGRRINDAFVLGVRTIVTF